MNTPSRILVPVDFSESSHAALEYAVLLAKKFGATVDILHAWQIPLVPGDAMLPGAGYSPVFTQAVQSSAEENLGRLKAELRKELPEARAFLVMSDPATAILEQAEKGYDLIVTGTHGRTGIKRFALGSVAERVVRHAPCAVLVHRPRAAKEKEGEKKS